MFPKIDRRLTDIRLIILSFIASGLISIRLGQDCNWDLRNYHFYNAYSFLYGRLTFDIVPAQIQSFHNPLLDLPFYWMITHIPPILYGFLVGGVQGINIWLIYKITYFILIDLSETKRRLVSLSAGITGYLGAANISELGTTFHDNVTSLFILGGLLLFVSSVLKNRAHTICLSRVKVIAAGFLMGLATGLKLPAAIYSPAFALSLLSIGRTWKVRITNAILASLSIVTGILAGMGYWMSILLSNFSSPLFPYYNGIFKSPYYEPFNVFDERWFPRDKYQILFYPFHFLKHSTLVNEVGFRDIRFALCYLLLMLFLFIILYKRIVRNYSPHAISNSLEFQDSSKNISVFIMIFFVASYVFWQKMFSVYRYLLPLELLSPLFIMIIVRNIFPFERVFTKLTIGVFALMIVTLSPMHWERAHWGKSFFDVKIPPPEKMAGATVILASDDALSYIIPFFPKTTRFVSVRNNLITPDYNNLLTEKIRKTLQESELNAYLLCKGKSNKTYDRTLAYYNLAAVKEKTAQLSTRFDHDLYLMPVTRITASLTETKSSYIILDSSKESLIDAIQKVYMGYYQRPAGPSGLVYWANRLFNTGGNLSGIIDAFANSAESRALYGPINSSNIPSVVTSIFEALFNRAPERAGLDYYVNGFNSGRFTAATIMLDVLYGAQNEDLQVVNNKVTAANLFTRTIDPDLDGKNFQATYSGDADAQKARNWLSKVGWDPATIPTQADVTLFIKNSIADPGDPILNR